MLFTSVDRCQINMSLPYKWANSKDILIRSYLSFYLSTLAGILDFFLLLGGFLLGKSYTATFQKVQKLLTMIYKKFFISSINTFRLFLIAFFCY